MAEVPGITASSLTPEQLAQINRLATIARFVSALAHELNNSLQVMGGLVELLAERDDLPADVLVRIGRIGAQADRASGKIRQVVSYVREPDQSWARLDLGSVVDRALTLRSYELGRAGVAVMWDLPVERFPVHGSARDLQQAVLNLLANAQEALAGAAARELTVGLARFGSSVRLSIGDTGPGVDAELRDRIFDAFFTTHAATGAVGLGLTVAAYTAAAHGGRLALVNDGPGATFVLELPLDDAAGDGGDNRGPGTES
jgi:signal transduction histidine kinase